MNSTHCLRFFTRLTLPSLSRFRFPTLRTHLSLPKILLPLFRLEMTMTGDPSPTQEDPKPPSTGQEEQLPLLPPLLERAISSLREKTSRQLIGLRSSEEKEHQSQLEAMLIQLLMLGQTMDNPKLQRLERRLKRIALSSTSSIQLLIAPRTTSLLRPTLEDPLSHRLKISGQPSPLYVVEHHQEPILLAPRILPPLKLPCRKNPWVLGSTQKRR